MGWRTGRCHEGRTAGAIEPISHLLTEGQCEPLKAAVHGLLLATVVVCAAYNTAAWFKRRQRHLAINAVVYGAAILWERVRVLDHLAVCRTDLTHPAAATTVMPPGAAAPSPTTAQATERDAA